MSLDIGTNLVENEQCDVGGNLLSADVQSDLMMNPEKILVKVKCAGCVSQKRFIKTVIKTNPTYKPEDSSTNPKV